MTTELFGFIGLCSMGRPMARNVADTGCAMIVFDLAGTADRAPPGAVHAGSVEDLAGRATVIALSLPTTAANIAVVEQIAASAKSASVVVDTCTIGPLAAARNAEVLAAAGVSYLDAPVSGMPVRAEEGQLASMVAGDETAIERARPLLEGYSRVVHRVGSRAGDAQSMKVVNNALYLSTVVVTCEALAYGDKAGLDLDTMLAVINDSSGANFATQHVFPPFIASGRNDGSGATASILEKDLKLFVDDAQRQDLPRAAIESAYETIRAFAAQDPAQDKARIYRFVRDGL